MTELNAGKMPLVSVVIPTYNRVHTLPRSIDSVLNQTYENLELIIMDDGSVDGTEEYIRGIEDSRIRYKRSDINQGPSAARNRGAELAQGEYLAFQDSDDEWMPDKLEKQMKLMLEDEDISLAYSEFGIYIGEKFAVYVPTREVPYEEKHGNIFAHLLLYPLIGTPTIVVKTKEFLAEGGFNETLKAYEDYEFTLRFAREHKVGFIGEELLKVNSSPDSVNRRGDERIYAQFFMVHEMLEPLRERNLLWRKLDIILHEAEKRNCHDAFIEELESLSRSLLYESECQCALAYLKKARESKETFIAEARARMQESMPGMKANILQVYSEQYESRVPWSAEQQSIVQRVMDKICDSEKIFGISEENRSRRIQIQTRLKEDVPKWEDQLYLLADIVESLELLEKI